MSWTITNAKWCGLAIATALLSACGGGSDGTQPQDDGPAQAIEQMRAILSAPLGSETACPDLALSTLQGVPGDVIALSGVPVDFGEPGFRIIQRTEKGELVDPLFAQAGAPQGEVRFVTPLSPDRNPEGGRVELELGDGEKHCPRVAFTILPLPEAPADYALTVQSDLERWIDQTLVVLGYDPLAMLNADPNSLPPAQLGLWLTKHYISDEDDPDALPAVARAAADDGDQTLERILMASNLKADLEAALLELETVPVGSHESTASLRNARRLLTRGDGRSSLSSSSCEEQQFDPDRLGIYTAAELSERMLKAKEGYAFDGSVSGQLLGGAALVDYKNTGNASGYAGLGVFAIATGTQARRALEPQSITSFEARANEVWVEDRPADSPLFWDEAMVTARGSTFNLSEATLQSLIALVGMVPGPVGAATTAATTVAPGAVNGAIADLTKNSCFIIRAPNYGPIRVTDEPWTESEIIGSTVEKVSHQQYRGINIGASELRVSLNGAKFGIAEEFEQRFTIEVQPLAFSLISAHTTVPQPGDTVEILATAANAFTNPADFIADVPSGNGEIISQETSGDFYRVQFKTPTDRALYPTGVRFTSNHRILPEGTAPHSMLATVDTGGKVTIEPRRACILPGQELPLSATLEGFQQENESVTWRATGGQITETDGFTATLVAPNQPGTVTVTVTADADAEVSDAVEYTVSEHCIKKVWYPSAVLSADGNGVYSPSLSAVCPEDIREDTQLAEIQTDPLLVRQPPDVPSDGELWFTRSASIGQSFTHSSTRYLPVDGACSSIWLHGSNTGSVRYEATGDGTLSLSLNADLTNACEAYASGDVECAQVGAGAGGIGMYYLTLGSEARYRLQAELRCSNLGSNVSILPITGVLMRYVAGTTLFEPFEDGNGNLITGVRNLNDTYRPPVLFSLACTEPDQVLPVEADFILDGPSTATDDLVVLVITGSLGVGPGSVEKIGFGPFGGIAFPPPVPEPGTYRSTANFDFSVTLTPQ